MLYSLDVGLFRSTDGGQTFKQLPLNHTDNHQLWIDPTNPGRMIEADDGGVTITVDNGATWSLQNNQPTGQFYHVSHGQRIQLLHLRRAAGCIYGRHSRPYRFRRDH